MDWVDAEVRKRMATSDMMRLDNIQNARSQGIDSRRAELIKPTML